MGEFAMKPRDLILSSCVSGPNGLLIFPSIVFVDACILQKSLKPNELYPPQ